VFIILSSFALYSHYDSESTGAAQHGISCAVYQGFPYLENNIEINPACLA
jgi:hypothetical protein